MTSFLSSIPSYIAKIAAQFQQAHQEEMLLAVPVHDHLLGDKPMQDTFELTDDYSPNPVYPISPSPDVETPPPLLTASLPPHHSVVQQMEAEIIQPMDDNNHPRDGWELATKALHSYHINGFN